MRILGYCFLVAAFVIGGVSCKSEFELIRSSGDPDAIYQEAINYYEQGEYVKAQTLFELIIGAFRGRPELEDIYYKYADTYYQSGRFILAAYYFQNFSNTFPTSPLRQEADFMSAFANYELSPSYRLDQQYTLAAIEGFQLFVNTYPENDRVSLCNQLIEEMRRKLEEKAYKAGELYFNLRQYQSATLAFENLLIDFPDTENGEEVRFMIVKSAYLLADNSVFEKRLERFSNALKYATEFIRKYPDSTFLDEAKRFLTNSELRIKELQDVRYQEQSPGSRS